MPAGLGQPSPGQFRPDQEEERGLFHLGLPFPRGLMPELGGPPHRRIDVVQLQQGPGVVGGADVVFSSNEGWGARRAAAGSMTVSAHEMYAGFWKMQTNGFSARDY